jgi:hypothetical protein
MELAPGMEPILQCWILLNRTIARYVWVRVTKIGWRMNEISQWHAYIHWNLTHPLTHTFIPPISKTTLPHHHPLPRPLSSQTRLLESTCLIYFHAKSRPKRISPTRTNWETTTYETTLFLIVVRGLHCVIIFRKKVFFTYNSKIFSSIFAVEEYYTPCDWAIMIYLSSVILKIVPGLSCVSKMVFWLAIIDSNVYYRLSVSFGAIFILSARFGGKLRLVAIFAR